ncbi:MAG TPA: LSM domain-containing protein [Thermoplasmata archaeon]|nr:LSM domain-containing protein [Thermoplasmata archaeon]
MVDAPLAVVERLVGQPVTLRLKDGRELDGKLLGTDDHLNLVLDDANERGADVARHLGRLVVRGSNIVSLNAANAAPGHAKGR